MKKRRAIVLVAILGAIFTGPKDAIADSITFNIQSMAQEKAQIVFYSQDRNYRWPGPGRAYDLSDYGKHQYKLNCITNEKICYGAWSVPNRRFTWGAGPGTRGACSGCCYTCRGNSTQLIVLRHTVSR